MARRWWRQAQLALSQVQNAVGANAFDVDTVNGCINVGATANCITNGSGGAALSAISTSISGNGLYGEDDQIEGNGVEGYSASGSGVYALSDTGDGLYAWSNGTAIGAQSADGMSGYFESGSSTNTATTLVTQQSGSATASLFQAVDSSNNILFNIGSSGAVKLENDANSTAAFQVDNQSGVALLTADTSNSAIVLGPDGTTQNITVRGGVATGSNADGSNITFQASDGTGGGGSGSFIFQTGAPSGSSIGVGPSGSSSTVGTNTTLSYTTPSDSSMLMMVQITTGYGNSVSTMTYNGSTLTQLPGSSQNAASSVHTEVWYMLAPPSGTHNLVVNLAGVRNFRGFNLLQCEPDDSVWHASHGKRYDDRQPGNEPVGYCHEHGPDRVRRHKSGRKQL